MEIFSAYKQKTMSNVRDVEDSKERIVGKQLYSIVICTYNPQHSIFSRTLNSISLIEIPKELKVECIIVDNNSLKPVKSEEYVQCFLEECSWAKIIREEKQGLTFARLAGVRTALGSVIIFVDDDNELDSRYLKALLECLQKYPSISALGPGKITVEFESSVSKWFEKTFRCSFQEKDFKHISYGSVGKDWASFYPFGTGLAVRNTVLKNYCEAIEAGQLSTTDRQGNSLASAGDIQIVWEAIKQGWAAGVSPDMKLCHIIPARRTSLAYMERLYFGVHASHFPALVESWPEERNQLPQLPGSLVVYKRLAKIAVDCLLKGNYRLIKVAWAQYLGEVTGLAKIIDNYRFVQLEKLARKLNFI